MDYGAPEPEKRMDKAYDYDYAEPAAADYIQPVDQGTIYLLYTGIPRNW